ncbi:LTA synthase family protein [Enterococcus rivorum]|uniref:LTA synthase family protein n=1 Tax=Enterococcus rivorum TaxID=762845 RepID=UPI001112D33D|nr:LTA synthase family protein [Enterococcus rivorum]
MSFIYDNTKSLIIDTLSTTLFSMMFSLFVYTFILNKSVEFISSLTRSTYILVNIFFCIFFLLFSGYLHSGYLKKHVLISRRKRQFARRILVSFIIFSSILFISLLTYTSSVWLVNTFGKVTIDQLLFSIQTLNGSSSQQVFDYINGPLITSAFITYLSIKIFFFLNYNNVKFTFLKNKSKANQINKFLLPIFSIVIFFCSLFLSINQVGFAQIKLYFTSSELIKNEYVSSDSSNLTFKDTKRNLIYIFVESLETSYVDKNSGGAQKNNLLKELTSLIGDDAINFSNNDKIGGALQIPGTEYTAAGIVAQTSGMPLKAPQQLADQTDLGANSFGMDESFNTGKSAFLPGLTTLGDILQKNDYKQTFIMGSDATFGGRRAYLSQHGNYEIIDYYEARDRNYFPKDYITWWGFEDKKLFSIAKEQASLLSSENKPFNLSLLTADTHFPDGYLDSETPNIYDDQYSNVIAHSSKQIADFVNWCKKQPFYENTTIVISGDHLTMDQKFVSSLPEDYERTVFNLFINAPIKPVNSKNRQFATIDLFPTTLASLGVEIKDNRLGIGTNLFSSKKTVIEKYSVEAVREELAKQSKFYTDTILKPKEKGVTYTNKKNTSESTAPATTESQNSSSSFSESHSVELPQSSSIGGVSIGNEEEIPEFEQ